VVGVRGVNASGEYFAVKEILVPGRLACPDVGVGEELGRDVRILIAGGPWGTDDGGWEGLEEICRVVLSEKVDVLLLVRDFVLLVNCRWDRLSMKSIRLCRMERPNCLGIFPRQSNPFSNTISQPDYEKSHIHK
jgi:hypothetical protein